MNIRSDSSTLAVSMSVTDQMRAVMEDSGGFGSALIGAVLGFVIAMCISKCCGSKSSKKGYTPMDTGRD